MTKTVSNSISLPSQADITFQFVVTRRKFSPMQRSGLPNVLPTMLAITTKRLKLSDIVPVLVVRPPTLRGPNMRDSINIGCTPSGEQCEQVGTPGYDPVKARFECNVFIKQLRRIFGDEPFGARLYVKSNPHDFGSYLEVECYYIDDGEDNASMDYAFRCEGEMPEWWDQAALDELNERYPGKYKLTIDD